MSEVKFKPNRTKAASAFDDVAEFGRALTGRSKTLGSFDQHFDGVGPVYVVRVPGRLDIMGGIADYSGSVVCEGLLGEAVVLGLQRRKDRQVRVYSVGLEAYDMQPRMDVSLGAFREAGRLVSYSAARNALSETAATAWGGYVAGCFYTLMREENAAFACGANIVLTSSIPPGSGISSSAAVEIATLHAINVAYDLGIDGLRLAHLGQTTENRVVGAPCGLMDQLATTLGKREHFLAIECQPDKILGAVRLPQGCAAVGINSRVRHSVGGSKYTDVRVATFMGHKIILSLMCERGQAGAKEDPTDGYLARITPKQFAAEFHDCLPSSIKGREFLDRYGDTCDSVTEVDPEKTYYVRSRASHPIHENARVREFLECLEEADRTGEEEPLIRAARLMYASHWSYRTRCGLDSVETNLLVKLVRNIGIAGGLYGAKITGGGSGGTVAVLGREDTIMDSVAQVVETYRQRMGVDPDVFSGTSPGALQFGHIEYAPASPITPRTGRP